MNIRVKRSDKIYLHFTFYIAFPTKESWTLSAISIHSGSHKLQFIISDCYRDQISKLMYPSIFYFILE